MHHFFGEKQAEYFSLMGKQVDAFSASLYTTTLSDNRGNEATKKRLIEPQLRFESKKPGKKRRQMGGFHKPDDDRFDEIGCD